MSHTFHPETIKLILEACIAFPEISYRKLGYAFSCSKTTAKSIAERATKTNIPLEDLVKLSNDELKRKYILTQIHILIFLSLILAIV